MPTIFIIPHFLHNDINNTNIISDDLLFMIMLYDYCFHYTSRRKMPYDSWSLKHWLTKNIRFKNEADNNAEEK